LNRPATGDQLEELRLLGQIPTRSLTSCQAIELLESIKSRNQDWQKAVTATFQQEEQVKTANPPPTINSEQFTISESEKSTVSPISELKPDDANLTASASGSFPPEPKITDPKYQVWKDSGGKE
jgi:hypothetical protein